MIALSYHPDLAQRALELGHALPTAPAVFGDVAPERMPSVRVSDLGWLGKTADTAWLFDAVTAQVEAANQGLGFALHPYEASMQWTVYRPGGHYDWHTDWAAQAPFNERKLSVSLCLTAAADYEGGEFEHHLSGAPQAVKMDLGCLIVFPSFVPHRVRPVTSGERVSLVAWFCGPPLT